MTAVVTIILVGVAAVFILSRSRRQHRPIGAFRSSSDGAAFLAVADSDGDHRGHDDGHDGDTGDSGDVGDAGNAGDAGDAGDAGGGDSGGGE